MLSNVILLSIEDLELYAHGMDLPVVESTLPTNGTPDDKEAA